MPRYTKSIEILRSMYDKKIVLTYTNGVSLIGILGPFDLGNRTITVEKDNEYIFINFNSVRSIKKYNKKPNNS